MFCLQNDDALCGLLADWLRVHKAQIQDGTAQYQGCCITEQTVFCRYSFVLSFGLGTISFFTPYDLPTAQNNYLRSDRWRCLAISGLAGWWCIPWGPFLTVRSLALNLRGGEKRTAASLLQLLEWGWDAPPDVSVTGHQKKLVELTDEAAREIRSRMEGGGFPENVGVRIMPTKWSDGELEIAFDYPVSDGRDWVDQSQGLLLLIDKNDEWQLAGSHIDYRDGRFVASLTTTKR